MIVIRKRNDGYGNYGNYGQESSVGEATGAVITRHERDIGAEFFTYGIYDTLEKAQATLDNAIVDAQNRGWTVYSSGINTMLDGTFQPWIKAIPPEQELQKTVGTVGTIGALKDWPLEEEKTSYWPYIIGGSAGVLLLGAIIYASSKGKRKK